MANHGLPAFMLLTSSLNIHYAFLEPDECVLLNRQHTFSVHFVKCILCADVCGFRLVTIKLYYMKSNQIDLSTSERAHDLKKSTYILAVTVKKTTYKTFIYCMEETYRLHFLCGGDMKIGRTVNANYKRIASCAGCQPGTSWWRHQMETFSASLALCTGNSPVTAKSPSQRPVTRSLMLSLIFAWINGWVNNREAGDSRRYRAHYDVIIMLDPWDIGPEYEHGWKRVWVRHCY